jgi:hypothetical protein
MSVDELFDRYKAAFEAGEASDPQPFLEQVSGADRRELEALVDGFLARGARRRYTPEAFAAAQASPLAQRVMAGASETWPVLLPKARDRAGILRSDLVTGLAEALGVSGRRDKVERYYHQMEKGLLEPSGVSDRVLDALSGIVGVSKERLRAAARPVTPPPVGAAFARVASAPAPRARRAMASPEAPEWDEVDELFRGGRSAEGDGEGS